MAARAADGVGAEHFDGGGHLADLVALVGVRHFDGQIATGELLHGVGETRQRSRDVAHDDEDGESQSAEHAEQRHAADEGQDQRLEAGDIGMDRVVLGLIVGNDSVDLRLVGLAVGAIDLVVAPGVGLFRRDRAKPRQLGAELPELGGPGNHCLESGQVGLFDQRPPLGEERIDGAERGRDAFGIGLGLLNGTRGIDAARVHHDGRDQTVQPLAVEGKGRRVVELVGLGGVEQDHGHGEGADDCDHGAHHRDDEKNSCADLQGNAPASGNSLPRQFKHVCIPAQTIAVCSLKTQ
jgi:hypothetical protein